MDQAAQQKLDTSPTRARHIVLAMLCLAALIAYVQRNSIGVAEETIRRELSLSKYEMGWVISCFFLTYAIFQIPTGYLGQVFGTRRALSMFAALFSLSAGVFGVAYNTAALIGTRLGMGALQAGIFPCAVNTVKKWIPERRRSFSTGMLASFMSIGGAIGAALTGFLIPIIGWRVAFVLYSLPGLVFAVWLYWWFRDRPQDHAAVNQAELELIQGGESPTNESNQEESQDEERAEPTPWLAILTSVPILALCAQQVFRAAGYMFFASWFATYLRETRELEGWVVGILTSLPLWAVVIGAPLGGLTSDWVLARTGNRRLSRQGVAAAAMLACALLVFISYPVANPWIAVLLISAGSFFAAFGGPCAYTSTIDMGGKHVPIVFSTMNMAGNFGAFVFPIIVPWLLSESELYVDQLRIVSMGTEASAPAEIFVEAEDYINSETKKIEKFGEHDATVIRFHHGTRSERRMYAEFEVNVPESRSYEIAVHFAGRDSPALSLDVKGDRKSQDMLGQSRIGANSEQLRWSQATAVDLEQGTNILRLETKTSASGNWDLVLFVFGGIYLVAFVCWLFVNTNVTIQSNRRS